ncbi:MAG: hypothetical protein QOH06_2058 [Acidobacteriota bacterium]|jgi:hypothetical protein|nr:hypothetical protein [Acidobacteriota bacterium]
MKKKTAKKLVLARETLRPLGVLVHARGGTDVPPTVACAPTDTCTVPSNGCFTSACESRIQACFNPSRTDCL